MQFLYPSYVVQKTPHTLHHSHETICHSDIAALIIALEMYNNNTFTIYSLSCMRTRHNSSFVSGDTLTLQEVRRSYCGESSHAVLLSIASNLLTFRNLSFCLLFTVWVARLSRCCAAVWHAICCKNIRTILRDKWREYA